MAIYEMSQINNPSVDILRVLTQWDMDQAYSDDIIAGAEAMPSEFHPIAALQPGSGSDIIVFLAQRAGTLEWQAAWAPDIGAGATSADTLQEVIDYMIPGATNAAAVADFIYSLLRGSANSRSPQYPDPVNNKARYNPGRGEVMQTGASTFQNVGYTEAAWAFFNVATIYEEGIDRWYNFLKPGVWAVPVDVSTAREFYSRQVQESARWSTGWDPHRDGILGLVGVVTVSQDGTAEVPGGSGQYLNMPAVTPSVTARGNYYMTIEPRPYVEAGFTNFTSDGQSIAVPSFGTGPLVSDGLMMLLVRLRDVDGGNLPNVLGIVPVFDGPPFSTACAKPVYVKATLIVNND